jgi:hypothetical protein
MLEFIEEFLISHQRAHTVPYRPSNEHLGSKQRSSVFRLPCRPFASIPAMLSSIVERIKTDIQNAHEGSFRIGDIDTNNPIYPWIDTPIYESHHVHRKNFVIHKLPTNPEMTHPSQNHAQIHKDVHILGQGVVQRSPEVDNRRRIPNEGYLSLNRSINFEISVNIPKSR